MPALFFLFCPSAQYPGSRGMLGSILCPVAGHCSQSQKFLLARPIFEGELLVSGREPVKTVNPPYDGKTWSISRFPKSNCKLTKRYVFRLFQIWRPLFFIFYFFYLFNFFSQTELTFSPRWADPKADNHGVRWVSTPWVFSRKPLRMSENTPTPSPSYHWFSHDGTEVCLRAARAGRGSQLFWCACSYRRRDGVFPMPKYP